MASLDPDLRALQEVRDFVERAHRAQLEVARYSQERIDAVCEAMSKAAAQAAHELAKLAVEETGIGRVHYKVLKNLFGSEGTWASIKDEKTVGIVRRDEDFGVIEVATPAGVIAGIVPTTNPTSTAINNAIISAQGAQRDRSSVPHPARQALHRRDGRGPASPRSSAPERRARSRGLRARQPDHRVRPAR